MNENTYRFLREHNNFYGFYKKAYYTSFEFADERSESFFIIISKDWRFGISWDRECSKKIEETPQWFQTLFALAKSVYEEQRKLRSELY